MATLLTYLLTKHVSSEECIIAAALLECQQFLCCAKHYAGSWLTGVGYIVNTHLLYIEHYLLQTVSGREEVQEHVRTERLTSIILICSYLHLSLLDHDKTH
mgnify:CR=1 FL=1